jgi:hypothetical protein
MKEVLTKSFWEGVKKTFDEALEGPPPLDSSNTPELDPTSGADPLVRGGPPGPPVEVQPKTDE